MMSHRQLRLREVVLLSAIFCVPSSAWAQSVGAAESFAVVGQAGVTAGGTGTAVTGDVGSSPSASITGFGGSNTVTPPFGIHANDAPAIAAQAADVALFTALGSGSCDDSPTAQMSGASFGPGIHCFSSTADLAASGNMTLTGAGTYIFRVPSSLTANVSSTVTMVGVDPCEVYWQVTSAATLNGVNFPGNVVAMAGVTLGVDASLTGRALATAGPVTLSGTNTVGGCSVASTPVPTLPQWGMIALTLLLAAAGFVALRRRAG
jgi:Ice-binding-like/IPTL-CTERM motif